MRVLLINPWASEYFPPPSIGYLQSALKYWKTDVHAMDLQEAMATTEAFDLVGVSFHSFSVKFARQIRDKFKGRLICGGHHPSAMPQQMLSIGYDQVVIGEGENAIIDIIEGNTNQIIRAEEVEHKYFFSINEIPVPDYSGLKFSGEMGIPIISSRGCPFRCNFCFSSDFWGHHWKARSAENVILEIEKRKSEGWKSWMMEDDNFTLDKNRTYEICHYLDGRFIWQCASRAESLDLELCKELYRAGCRTVWLGVESLSQSALDRCNKNTTVNKMVQGILNARQSGLQTVCQLIAGLPGDSLEDILITRSELKKHKITAGYNIAWILPKTNIYDEAVKRGFRDEIYLSEGAPFYTYEYDLKTLKQWATYV